MKQTMQTLEQAIDGLLYMSESDEPFEVVQWPGDGKPVDAQKLLKLTSSKPGTPIIVMYLEDFFSDLTVDQQWYGDEEKATTEKYRNLEASIRQNLSDIQVFKIGKTQVDIYIIGTTMDGDWAGVKTTSVET